MPGTPDPSDWETGIRTVFGIDGLNRAGVVNPPWIIGTGHTIATGSDQPWFTDPHFGKQSENEFTLYKKQVSGQSWNFFIVQARVDWFEGGPSPRVIFDKIVIESQMALESPQNKLDPESFRAVATSLDNIGNWISSTLQNLNDRRHDLDNEGSGFKGSSAQAVSEFIFRLSAELDRHPAYRHRSPHPAYRYRRPA